MSAMSARTATNRSDRSLALGLAAFILVMGVSAWGWQQYKQVAASSVQGAPIYLNVDKIEAQLADGSILAFKFGLQLRNIDDQKALTPYAPAFRQMVESMTNQFTHEELASPESMSDMNSNIRATVNNYLVQQGMPQRVENVYFEDWLLLM